MDTDDQTRQPRSPEDYATMIMQLLGSDTMADAYSKVSALMTIRPVVWRRVDNSQLEVAPDLTVGGTFAVIRFLEGRPIR